MISVLGMAPLPVDDSAAIQNWPVRSRNHYLGRIAVRKIGAGAAEIRARRLGSRNL
jgi:hypothetical protein